MVNAVHRHLIVLVIWSRYLPFITLLFASTTTLSSLSTSKAQSATTELSEQVNRRPSIVAVQTTQPPIIDGQLEDPVWQTAARIVKFVQHFPIEGAPATEQTEVYLAYDSLNIYIGIYAHYSDMNLVRVNHVDRDQTYNDDTVTISFDPFLDSQRGYAMSVNGFGVQSDALLISTPGGTTTDSSWNGLYQSAGVVVHDGWTAEMAIPVKSLRYPSKSSGETHRWGFQVQRNIHSKNEIVSWSPLSSNIIGTVTQMGILEGLRDLSTQRNFEIMPTVTALRLNTLQPNSHASSESIGRAGMNVKYGITSGLTLDLTVNPDFSQIESDRPQIEINQRFPLFFPELRPFFLEGQEVFRTNGPSPFLHTRTIIDPQFGMKLTGKIGRTTLGLLAANDQAPGRVETPHKLASGKSASIIAGRLRYDLYRESYTGVMLINREFEDTYSRLGIFDNTLRFGKNHVLGAMIVLSDHRDTDGVRRTGHFIDIGTIRQGRNLRYFAAFHSISPNFRNESGFLKRTNQQQLFGSVSYLWWPEHWITNFGPRINYDRLHDYKGNLQDEERGLTMSVLFANNIRLSASLNRDMERFQMKNYHKTRIRISGHVDTSRYISFSANLSYGDEIRFIEDPFLGQITTYNTSLILRPMSRLQSELHFDTTRFIDTRTNTEVFDVKLLYVKTTYQLTNRLLARGIIESNTFEKTLGANLLVTYRVNAGTVFFIGYDDRYKVGDQIDQYAFPTTTYQRKQRAVFAKFQYLFRR